MSDLARAPRAGARADAAQAYPALRYMGSKHRLLPWLAETFARVSFTSALDLFSGSGSVSYLLKTMGKRMIANDFLEFAHHLAIAAIENPTTVLAAPDVEFLCRPQPACDSFIERTFSGIFYTAEDLRFLDIVSANLRDVHDRHTRALVQASLTRACMKKQPRGVFTVAGAHSDDGRRDLRLTLEEHFRESVEVFNGLVFDNGQANLAMRTDALAADCGHVDLVYMDPPYVPRADDNCYVKRYHFLEGLASYWTAPGTEVVPTSRVRKIPKRFTPFSYRHTAPDAFDAMFRRFADSTLVLSYSSNGFPDLQALVEMMRRYKPRVEVVRRPHRYHFGTHARVAPERAQIEEYLLLGFSS
jgi:DNA adenine methylase/adenine-specific DNA-methyltransferase